MISLLLLSLLAQTSDTRIVRPERLNGSRESGRTGGAAYAFFEAFPVNGAGTSGACSTTAPTGAKGEALTFTRGSTATCTKTATGGLATTGIANGDLVVLSSNVARVEYDSAGTLGLLVEASRTNKCLRSQEFDNAAWTLGQTGAPGLPTVTANFATAPDGTLTADRFQVPAVSAAQDSYTSQVNLCTAAGPCSVAVYGRANSSNCSLDICSYTGGATSQCVRTGLVTTGWVRLNSNATAQGGSGSIAIGSLGVVATGGLGANGACDALLWQADAQDGSYMTSPIPTTSAAVTRSAELASFPVTPASVATGSISTRVQLLATATNGLVSATASGTFKQAVITFGGERAYVGGVSLVGPLSALTAGQHSAVVWWDGTSTNLVLDGATTSGAAGTPSATNALQVGNYDATTNTDEPGIYSRLCLDPSPTRCR